MSQAPTQRRLVLIALVFVTVVAAVALISAVVVLRRWGSDLHQRELKVRGAERAVNERVALSEEMAKIADEKMRLSGEVEQNAKQMMKEAKEFLEDVKNKAKP